MLTVYLADLRYNYQGFMTTDAMPLGIGYIKSYMDKELSGKVESSIYATPDDLESAIQHKMPDVFMLSNYVWNEQLGLLFAKYIKSHNENCLIVMGGPNISLDDYKKKKYLEQHPYIDIFVTGQGDFLATEIVKLFLDSNLSISNLLKNHIHSAIYKQSGRIIITSLEARTRYLDDIPSPYLTGVMDKFFNGKFSPMLETNRGCPFSCTFCVQGTKWYTKVNYFSIDRVKAELDYMAKAVFEKCPNQKLLRIVDANYGMYERDIEISEHIGKMQKDYNWPLIIDATTGKNQAERIIKSLEKLNGALIMYQAVQSFNDEVLYNIKRKNISLETYQDIQFYVKSRGMKSNSDLIFGLPGESLETHLEALKKLIESDTSRITTFQGMMLKGSDLESDEHRNKYALETLYRLIPKGFGKYFGQKVFDFDEIIIANEKTNFSDYLKARMYSFGISVFWNSNRFQHLIMACNNAGISNWEWFENLMTEMERLFQTDPQWEPLSNFLNDFMQETKSELFKSEEEAWEYYSQDENFEQLLENNIGDNLVYKYRGLANFLHWEQLCKLVFTATYKLVKPKVCAKYFDDFYNEFERFMINLYAFGQNKKDLLQPRISCSQYDILAWSSVNDFNRLFEFKQNKLTYKFELDEVNKKYLEATLAIWGYDKKSFSMLIKRVDDLWLLQSCIYLNTPQN